MKQASGRQSTQANLGATVRDFCAGIEKAFSSILGVTLNQTNQDTMLTLAERFSTENQIIASVPFSGGVTGEFFICVKGEDWLTHLAQVSGMSEKDPGIIELLHSTLQELINTAAGEAIGSIKEQFGLVTMLSPRLIKGVLYYPATKIFNLSFVASENQSPVDGRLSLDLMEQEIIVENEKLKKDSRMDDTGLFNKKHFIEVLADIESKFEKAGYFSIIFVDINRLKYVNDTFGHDAGDRYIQAACNVLQQSCRYSDYCFRIGGDELVVILPKCKMDDISHVIQRIHKSMNKTYIKVKSEVDQEDRIQLHMSIGFASNSEHGIRAQDVLKTADMRMEQDKKAWYKSQKISRRK